MNSKHTPVSKPGTVGTNMPRSLAGDRDNEGPISGNYKGRPRNADPNYMFHPGSDNSQTVSDWTKNHMKERREEALKVFQLFSKFSFLCRLFYQL
uniref:Protein SMG7 n=1 Tax=Heterorhabditis bacteriophora TaxID=37862 RepID=A0A1I7W6H1_HETBA